MLAFVQVLWLPDCVAIWRSVYFLPHISIVAIILCGLVLPPGKPTSDVTPSKALAGVEASGKAAGNGKKDE
jgi:hypothetical protein